VFVVAACELVTRIRETSLTLSPVESGHE